MKKEQVAIIVGSQWGDEGKGKIVDYFTKESDYVVRFQGGNNAGHTIVIGDKTYKLNLIPSGVLDESKVSIIGNGVLIDPKVLLSELENLSRAGVKPNLKISQRAHVIMPYHIAMDEALSGHQGNLSAGSTKRGIAPVAGDKMYRQGIRMVDLLEPDILREKLAKAYQFNIDILQKVFGCDFSLSEEEIYREYLDYGLQLKEYLEDTEVLLYGAYKNGKKILYEGAQGMSLDPDHGVYPHTTSTNNVAPYSGVGSGLGINSKSTIIGLVKGYVSRVGKSPFPTEILGEEAVFLRDKGGEYGTVTKRPRRVGWLDLIQVRQSVRTSGLTDLAVTKLDVLGGFKEIKICIGYEVDGRKLGEIPASLTQYRLAKPIYKVLSGWEEFDSTFKQKLAQKGYEALPKEVKDYLQFIEDYLDVPVSVISYGPERNETIIR
jgi:adenylosuccinate synthase